MSIIWFAPVTNDFVIAKSLLTSINKDHLSNVSYNRYTPCCMPGVCKAPWEVLTLCTSSYASSQTAKLNAMASVNSWGNQQLEDAEPRLSAEHTILNVFFFLFWLFETGFLCVSLAVLEFTL